jgi:hypothetical protein
MLLPAIRLQDDNDTDIEIEASAISQANGFIASSNLILLASSRFCLCFCSPLSRFYDACPRTLSTKILHSQPHELAAMMDDSHSSKKGPTAFVHGPEMEGSFAAGVNASAGAGQVLQEEEIKRDLHSRHINMIAIAGMIVRAPFSCNPHESSSYHR